MNLVEPGDVVIVGVNGVFGERMCEVARRGPAPRSCASTRTGGHPSTRAACSTLSTSHPEARLLAVVHAETSTGVENDVAALGPIHDTDTLLLVDAVTSLAGIPLAVDEWGVDACYSGTQKCLGVPPGLAPLTLSPRAVERLNARTHPVQSWYLDLGLIGDYVGTARKYHHTAPTGMIVALHAGLGAVLDEGLPAVWARHREVGTRLQDALTGRGFSLIAPEGARLPQLTSVRLPAGLDEAALRARLLAEHSIEVGGGLGRVRRRRVADRVDGPHGAATARWTRCSARSTCCSSRRTSPEASAARAKRGERLLHSGAVVAGAVGDAGDEAAQRSDDHPAVVGPGFLDPAPALGRLDAVAPGRHPERSRGHLEREAAAGVALDDLAGGRPGTPADPVLAREPGPDARPRRRPPGGAGRLGRPFAHPGDVAHERPDGLGRCGDVSVDDQVGHRRGTLPPGRGSTLVVTAQRVAAVPGRDADGRGIGGHRDHLERARQSGHERSCRRGRPGGAGTGSRPPAGGPARAARRAAGGDALRRRAVALQALGRARARGGARDPLPAPVARREGADARALRRVLELAAPHRGPRRGRRRRSAGADRGRASRCRCLACGAHPAGPRPARRLTSRSPDRRRSQRRARRRGAGALRRPRLWRRGTPVAR